MAPDIIFSSLFHFIDYAGVVRTLALSSNQRRHCHCIAITRRYFAADTAYFWLVIVSSILYFNFAFALTRPTLIIGTY